VEKIQLATMESRNQQLIQMMQATKKEPKITCVEYWEESL
jgi:hypothetical protein